MLFLKGLFGLRRAKSARVCNCCEYKDLGAKGAQEAKTPARCWRYRRGHVITQEIWYDRNKILSSTKMGIKRAGPFEAQGKQARPLQREPNLGAEGDY
jgi:hypothetical protein